MIRKYVSIQTLSERFDPNQHCDSHINFNDLRTIRSEFSQSYSLSSL